MTFPLDNVSISWFTVYVGSSYIFPIQLKKCHSRPIVLEHNQPCKKVKGPPIRNRFRHYDMEEYSILSSISQDGNVVLTQYFVF